MSKLTVLLSTGLCAFILTLTLALPARADVRAQIKELERRVDEQLEQIQEQKKEIDSLKKGSSNVNAKAAPTATPAANMTPQSTVQQNQSLTPPAAPTAEPEQRPQIEALADQGGVLSPKGMLTFESTTEYTNTTRNLFSFNGVELSQVVLVGAINDTAAQHQIVQQTGRLRMGLTDRLEGDIHIPFVYRNDSLTNTNTTTGAQTTTALEGHDIGDIDAGLAYQLNNGTHGWPFLIGNVRYKANNADGPYDVPYDANNFATRLPTGTGFQTVEASVTAIKVNDPAVLFGNLGYVYDVPRDINHNFAGTYVSSVNPGDAVNALVGMAFAINQDTSFTLGYKHSYVFPTIQHSVNLTNGTTSDLRSGSSQVGAVTLGLTYAVTPTTPVNFNIEAGVTNDAPDVHLMLRIPFQLGKVF